MKKRKKPGLKVMAPHEYLFRIEAKVPPFTVVREQDWCDVMKDALHKAKQLAAKYRDPVVYVVRQKNLLPNQPMRWQLVGGKLEVTVTYDPSAGTLPLFAGEPRREEVVGGT